MMADGADIVIVGVCGTGKSTLARDLRQHGYQARSCAQEHSYVPDLWRHHGQPVVLIYLDANCETVCRRLDVHWSESVLAVQRVRLADAREHCDLYIATDNLSVEEVLEEALAHLRRLEAACKGGAAT